MKTKSFTCVAIAALMMATPALAAGLHVGTGGAVGVQSSGLGTSGTLGLDTGLNADLSGSASTQATTRAQGNADVDTSANTDIHSGAEANVIAPAAGLAMDADTGLPDADAKTQAKAKARLHERTAGAHVKAKTDAQAQDDDGIGLSVHGKVNTQMPALNATAGGGLDAPVSR